MRAGMGTGMGAGIGAGNGATMGAGIGAGSDMATRVGTTDAGANAAEGFAEDGVDEVGSMAAEGAAATAGEAAGDTRGTAVENAGKPSDVAVATVADVAAVAAATGVTGIAAGAELTACVNAAPDVEVAANGEAPAGGNAVSGAAADSGAAVTAEPATGAGVVDAAGLPAGAVAVGAAFAATGEGGAAKTGAAWIKGATRPLAAGGFTGALGQSTTSVSVGTPAGGTGRPVLTGTLANGLARAHWPAIGAAKATQPGSCAPHGRAAGARSSAASSRHSWRNLVPLDLVAALGVGLPALAGGGANGIVGRHDLDQSFERLVAMRRVVAEIDQRMMNRRGGRIGREPDG